MEQLRRRIGQHEVKYDEIEDELEYNYQRKEELKRYVQRLEEDITYLRAANFKNARIQIENESKMEACIKSLELEIEDLKPLLENYEDIKSENKALISCLEFTEQEYDDNIEKYKKEIETLRSGFN